jgi:hypothetical protein
MPAAAAVLLCLQTVSDYQRVFRMAYAKVLDIPESEVNIQKVACSGSVLSAGDTGISSSTATPKPTRHRALLQSSQADALAAPAAAAAAGSRTLLVQSASKQAKAPPASVSTVFEVPAPSDPEQRQQMMDLINQNSGQVLGPAMTILFEHPVEIDPPVLLSAPGLTRQPLASPALEDEPDTTELEEEVEAVVEELPVSPSPSPMLNGTAELNMTAPSPAPGLNGTGVSNLTLPNATVPEAPPGANGTNVSLPQSPAPAQPNASAPSPAPSPAPTAPEEVQVTAPLPVYMPPAPPAPIMPWKRKPPQQENWEKAQPCMFAPTGANSIPDKQGRLWGWIGGESCAFKSITGKAAVTVSWDTAVDCAGAATTSNSVFDGNGRLWGWQRDRSCAFRGAQTQVPGFPGQELVTWESAPGCKGIPWGSNAVRGADGMLWGYENGNSCAFRTPGINPSVTWAAAPYCVGAPHYYKPVRDSYGRLWGFENGKSCRF